MVVNDPIADMLTRIRNAQVAKHDSVTLPASNTKKAIAKILLAEGYVKSVDFIDDGLQGEIKVTLKYINGKTPVIAGLKRISKPGLRVYARCEELKWSIRTPPSIIWPTCPPITPMSMSTISTRASSAWVRVPGSRPIPPAASARSAVKRASTCGWISGAMT